jgi:nitroreductase
MDVLEAIKTRRSIRKYKSDPVSEADLNQVLESIRWSPSWANTQCWEVIVVTDDELRAKLRECFPKYNPGASALTAAPVAIVMAARKADSGYYKGKAVTRYGDWALFDVGLAMQNLALAAHALGLAGVDMGYFDHAKVEHLLGVPENVQVVAITTLGYPDEAPEPPSRKGLDEFVSYEQFSRR